MPASVGSAADRSSNGGSGTAASQLPQHQEGGDKPSIRIVGRASNVFRAPKVVMNGTMWYTGFTLRFLYNIMVYYFENCFVWGCPTKVLLQHYNKHVSRNHMDVGVGTAWLLDHCTFPKTNNNNADAAQQNNGGNSNVHNAIPRIILADISETPLRHAAGVLARYQPTCILANVVAEDRFPEDLQVESVGMNYLLHCVPPPPHANDSKNKKFEVVFSNVLPALKQGGVLFGSTIMTNKDREVKYGVLGRAFLWIYNTIGLCNNMEDYTRDLRNALESMYDDVDVKVVGTVAVFSAKKRAE